jgi:hypothetical protein
MGFFVPNTIILNDISYFYQNILYMTFKNGLLFSTIIILVACNSTNKKELQSVNVEDTSTYITNDTISNFRNTINLKPVDSFSKNVPDKFNNWVFSINVYETKETFKYLMRIKYKELAVTDSLRIPNFGILPKVILKDGKEPLSCIIGFADKKGNFKEFRKVFIDKDRLRIVALKSYFVGVYQTKK